MIGLDAVREFERELRCVDGIRQRPLELDVLHSRHSSMAMIKTLVPSAATTGATGL